jgi:uncharacterized membrane protein
MELLGLIAVLFFLYLLIAPAVAWAKANAARAASEELKSALETRTRDLTDLRKQIVGLREQQLALLRRFEELGTIAPAAPTESVGPVPAPAARAATPTAAERSTRADFGFDPADFGMPDLPAAAVGAAAAPTTAAPAPATPAPVPTPLLPLDAVPEADPHPAQKLWDLEPIEPVAAETAPVSAAPTEPVKPAADVPSRPFGGRPAGQSPERPTAPDREPVWKPKPPVGRKPPPRRLREPTELEGKAGEWLQAAKGWLFGGNLVAKIGLMILFIGVAFLLRFASAFVVVPIEVRLAGIAAGAIALLGWGWHIRNSRPGIALPAQGAALATLMLVTFGAFKIYRLLPSGPTFALLLVLVAFTCVLAVLQDALWLAVFGIVGGFAVPILTSSGSGSHVALFSYYAVLNAGIVAIAWRRSWRSLNFLGFLFTFLIGTAWGVQRYEAAHYDSAQFFLALFVIFYAAIAILYAWRQAPQLKSYVDATLVFGVPIVAMGLQYGMVKDMHLGSALSALAFGLFYATLGLLLWRWRAGTLRLLVESFLALGVVFGTLAIPLAFDGRWTSAAWALQGAGMVWVGLRQKQALVWRFGILLQFGSWLAFVKSLTGLDPLTALTEHISLGFGLLGATGVFLALTLRRQSLPVGDDQDAARARFGGWAGAFITVAVIWLLGGLWVEVWLRVDGVHRASLYVLTAMALVYALQWLGRRSDWRVPAVLGGAVTALAGLTFLGLMARYMRWHNVEVYPEQSFGEVLSGGALFGGALLSAGALVSAFAFKRRWQQALDAVQDPSRDQRAATGWLLLTLFWFCGFALHGAAHALAWLTSPAADAAAAWYQISFWAAYSIGLAVSAWGAMALAQRFAFPNRDLMLRIGWPALSAVAIWAFLVQVSPDLMIERLLQFNWGEDGSGPMLGADALHAFLGGPLAGALILAALAWIGIRRVGNAARAPDLSDEQRSTGIAVWLIGLGIVVHLLLVDVLAQLTTRTLLAQGAVAGEQLGWLSYADARLAWMTLVAIGALALAQRTGLTGLRWLAAPTAVVQALAWLTLLVQVYERAQLPRLGTGAALLLAWLGMAWCMKFWQARWSVTDAGIKGMHFSRVIAPWLMLAPVLSLNLMPWLVGEGELAVDMAESGWIVAGMWPDYLAAWASIGALFLGLMQVRRAGWPLLPLHEWYGRLVIPAASFWALLLAIYWNLRQDGGMTPLPYLPLLNPLDLTTGFVALLLADLWRLHGSHASTDQRRLALRTSMALAFAWFNLMLLRTAAKFLGLPYRFEPLYQSYFVQAMLSLVWTLCAFALMRFAARRLSKPLWMVGAALLGVVVLKLFLVDLRNVEGVARIVSFMGVGGLMLLIGYLAPLPREAEQASSERT